MTHDGRAFVLNLQTDASGPAQVIRIRMSNGEITKLTDDRATYAGASIAGEVIVTSRAESHSSLWLSEPDGRQARQVGQEIPGRVETLGWIGNERVTYDASLAEGTGVWSTDLCDWRGDATRGTRTHAVEDRRTQPDAGWPRLRLRRGRRHQHLDSTGRRHAATTAHAIRGSGHHILRLVA